MMMAMAIWRFDNDDGDGDTDDDDDGDGDGVGAFFWADGVRTMLMYWDLLSTPLRNCNFDF